MNFNISLIPDFLMRMKGSFLFIFFFVDVTKKKNEPKKENTNSCRYHSLPLNA